jgi:hypothetical protein
MSAARGSRDNRLRALERISASARPSEVLSDFELSKRMAFVLGQAGDTLARGETLPDDCPARRLAAVISGARRWH